MAAGEGTAPPSSLYWTEGNRTRQGRGGVERWKKCVFSPDAGKEHERAEGESRVEARAREKQLHPQPVLRSKAHLFVSISKKKKGPSSGGGGLPSIKRSPS